MTIEDLKRSQHNSQPMTVSRAFTLCELIAYRIRDDLSTREGAVTSGEVIADEIAKAIREVALTWEGLNS